MSEEKNTLLPLVENLMEKQRKQNDKLKAEQFIELQTNKDEILEQVKAVADNVSGLQKNIDVMETKMLKNNLEKTGSIHGSIGDELHKNEFGDKLKVWDSRKGSNDFTFSTPIIQNQITIHDPTSFVAGVAPVVLPFREAGVDKTPVRPPTVSDIIMWGTTTSNLVDWIERTDKTNGAATRAENATMLQGDLEYTEVSTKVKIISEFMKVTNESLKDVDFLAGEINSELLSDIRLLTDSQLLSGDGTGTNLLGIIPQATAFAAGTFALAIIAPNNADVLRVAINQIILAGQGRWFPNYILMNPDDVAILDLTKIADGRYIEIPYYDADGPSVIRVPILQNPGIAQDTFLLGDFSKAKAFIRDALTIRIFDQNEDDPLFNRSTITGNIRLAFRIKNQEKGAFVTGTFSTAITALTKA